MEVHTHIYTHPSIHTCISHPATLENTIHTHTLRDYQIKPSSGVNCFNTSMLPGENGTYEIYLTPRGDLGFPNELGLVSNATANQCGLFGCLALVLMRIYTDELSPDALQDKAR